MRFQQKVLQGDDTGYPRVRSMSAGMSLWATSNGCTAGWQLQLRKKPQNGGQTTYVQVLHLRQRHQ